MDEARYRVAERALWKSLNVTPTEHMIELPSTGSSVRIQEIGQGDPVLFVHGGAVNGSSWAPLAAELSDFRCLLVDLPGCGLSPAPPKTYSEFEDFYLWADDLVADVLDGVGVDSAPVICTSFGGYYAFRGAAAHPQRFDQLVGAGAIFGSRMDHMPMVMRVGSIRPFAKLMARMPANRRVVRAMLRQIGLKDALKAGRVTGVFEEWFIANMRHTDTLKNAVEVVPLVINMRGMFPRLSSVATSWVQSAVRPSSSGVKLTQWLVPTWRVGLPFSFLTATWSYGQKVATLHGSITPTMPLPRSATSFGRARSLGR